MFLGTDSGKWLALCQCYFLFAVPNLLHILHGPARISDEVNKDKHASANLFCSFFLTTIHFLTTLWSTADMNTAFCSFLERADP